MKKKKKVGLNLKKTKVSELNASFKDGLKGGNGSYNSAVNGSCDCGGGNTGGAICTVSLYCTMFMC